jgi:hypothetical protein
LSGASMYLTLMQKRQTGEAAVAAVAVVVAVA